MDVVHVNGPGSLVMDPLRSEACWRTFKYFIIVIISMNYIFVHLLDNKVLNVSVFRLPIIAFQTLIPRNKPSTDVQSFFSRVKVKLCRLCGRGILLVRRTTQEKCLCLSDKKRRM